MAGEVFEVGNMTAREKEKATDASALIPVWVHDKGLKGYDEYGNPVEEMAVNNYGYTTRIIAGMQPADTDPLELKEYRPKRAYKTRQIKAEPDVSSVED